MAIPTCEVFLLEYLSDPRRLAAGGRTRKPASNRPVHQRPRTTEETTRILIIGLIRELALYRAEVLRHHGFRVLTPDTVAQASAIIERGDFDVAVLSYTLPSSTVEDLADQVRERCPACPIVAISDTQRHDRLIAPDAVALAKDGPPALIAALRQVLRRN